MQMRSLKDVTAAELAKLRLDVQAANGRVIVLAHPFYWHADKKYVDVVEGLIAKSKIPVVILEERSHVDHLKEKMRNELKAPERLVLPTEPNFMRMQLTPEKIEERECGELVRILQGAGAKEVRVGGYFATIVPTSKNVRAHERGWLPRIRKAGKETVGGGCAGAVYRELIYSGKFERVKHVPGALYPHKQVFEVSPRRLKAARKRWPKGSMRKRPK